MKRVARPKRARTEAREARQAKEREKGKLAKRLAKNMPHDYQLQVFGRVVVL